MTCLKSHSHQFEQRQNSNPGLQMYNPGSSLSRLALTGSEQTQQFPNAAFSFGAFN